MSCHILRVSLTCKNHFTVHTCKIFIISATDSTVLSCIAITSAGIVWSNGWHVHQSDAAKRTEKSESSQWPTGKAHGGTDS